jgi:hypothetical protein
VPARAAARALSAAQGGEESDVAGAARRGAFLDGVGVVRR